LEIIKNIRPEVLIKGSDWKDKGGAVGSEYAGEVHFVPLVEDRSTTNLIEKIKTLVS
jgi:D-beta-D-heptose 7-phosphate kinase/D-beta-D-heptose 1-phosphate adenosyltransferase